MTLKSRSLCSLVIFAFACSGLAPFARAQGGQFGIEAGVPVPGFDVGSHSSGLQAGVTGTRMLTPFVGVGGDLVYHDWPASAGYTRAFDRYLRTSLWRALDGSTWSFPATQLTGHVRYVPLPRDRVVPWMQAGAGLYFVDFNFDAGVSSDSYAWVTDPSGSHGRNVFGWYGAVGADVRVARPFVIGLGATVHHVRMRETTRVVRDDLPDFSGMSLTLRVLVER